MQKKFEKVNISNNYLNTWKTKRQKEEKREGEKIGEKEKRKQRERSTKDRTKEKKRKRSRKERKREANISMLANTTILANIKALSQYSHFHPCVPELRIPVDGFECVVCPNSPEWSLAPPPLCPQSTLHLSAHLSGLRRSILPTIHCCR
ncbi:hypothetical protein GOODEAATRI_019234 [Goodea atripinnis]|uniref:Uncharacterized protein n=1 Tax=Goodea atripinnis TaxID=208336 RepID=A0ABV0PPW8_9TELE